MRRRTFLAVTGAGVLSGCGALGGNSFEQVSSGDAISNVKNATGLDDDEVGKSARAQLKQGQFTAFSFNSDESANMEFTMQVVTGGKIDVYVMTVDEYNEFQQEPQLVSAKYEYEGVKNVETTENVGSEGYNLVYDNTYIGETEPSGNVELQFEFKLTDRNSGSN